MERKFMEYQNYSTAETTDLFPEQAVIYGSFWERLLAVLIDGFILALPNYFTQKIIGDFKGYIA